ncbi:armadillo/beta-catenin-like repeat domain-containing protein [Ditylenchus destructor]|uniref:Importin subunit alpha n=1 Tax=Ditylenchus destructor TaxID=166010 RepID=A0AAD4MGS9_9BILA|nr:armadillo/beta-catenin-like repeat domain-containing protein [Ditylenchus destructor]
MSLSDKTNTGEKGDRTKLYKNVGKTDVQDARRRRTDCSIELRRQKRNDEMMKRRNLTLGEDSDSSFTSDTALEGIETASSEATSPMKAPAVVIQESIQILTNNPSIVQLQQVFEGIRRILSRSKEPPVQEMVDSGLVVALVKGLDVEDEKVQFECAWALTNIVSGTSAQTLAVVKAGATQPLLQLAASPSLKLAEQAIWAIANIVGDSTELRDHMIENGLVSTLNRLVDLLPDLNDQLVRVVAWTYSNLVRHKTPQIRHTVLREVVPGIAKLMKYPDRQTNQDACWALSYMTDGADENIQMAYQNEVIPDVVRFVSTNQDSLIAPALRVLGNFATGNDELTQVVCDSGVLKHVVPQLLQRNTISIVKESCWLVSNVLAGTNSQIEEVIDAGLLPLLLSVLKNGDHRSQYEAGWAIANIAHGGSVEQIFHLTRTEGCVEAICHCLNVKNNELISNMVDALYVVLTTVANNDPMNLEKVKITVEECNGLDYLETLQRHESQRIYDMAFKIVDEFFNDEEDEGENLEPTQDTPMNLSAPSGPYNF